MKGPESPNVVMCLYHTQQKTGTSQSNVLRVPYLCDKDSGKDSGKDEAMWHAPDLPSTWPPRVITMDEPLPHYGRHTMDNLSLALY